MTLALKIDHIVSPEKKKERSHLLLEYSEEKRKGFYQQFIGQTMPVLFEHSKSQEIMGGFTPNYIRVEVPYDSNLNNKIYPVQLIEFNDDQSAIRGEIIY